MNYIIIGILVLISIIVSLVLIVIIQLVNKVKNNDRSDKDVVERLGKLEVVLTKDIGDFKLNFSRDLTNDFNKLNERIESKLML